MDHGDGTHQGIDRHGMFRFWSIVDNLSAEFVPQNNRIEGSELEGSARLSAGFNEFFGVSRCV